MKAFVTGATGFIGSHLTKFLVDSGIKVKILTRNHNYHSELPIEIAYGDILDKDSLEGAMHDCNILIHLAAFSGFWSSDKNLFYKINFVGTRNVMETALKLGFDKVIHVSTRGVLTQSNGNPINESSLFICPDKADNYIKSKLLSEKLAFDFNKSRLPVIIVSPTAVIGPEDRNPSAIGRIIINFLMAKRFFFFLQGRINLVDVRDVAKGILSALKIGIPTERYVIGNKNITLKGFFSILNTVSKKNILLIRVPYSLGLGAAFLSEQFSKIIKKPPMVTVSKVKTARANNFCDNSKSKDSLKLCYTDFNKTIEDTVSWFMRNGYVQ